MFGHHYGFKPRDVLQLTRKLATMLLEHVSKQNYADKAFEAKLHGFKMNAPIAEQQWEAEEDERLTSLAKERYDKMMAQAKEPRI